MVLAHDMIMRIVPVIRFTTWATRLLAVFMLTQAVGHINCVSLSGRAMELGFDCAKD